MWWLNARNIGLYAAADGEVDLAPLTLALHRMGKRLALPVIEPAGSMRFYRYRPGDRTVRNRYNISEPASAASPSGPLELLLVPLVAFDAEGNRLGMGAGYYDRYAARHPCRLVGVAHDCQRATALPVAPWDQPLHGVVTESGFVSFGS